MADCVLRNTMSCLSAVALRVLHFIYFTIVAISSTCKNYLYRDPLPLAAPRKKLPRHLALLILDPRLGEEHVESFLLETVDRAVKWCQTAGVERLTIFDNQGFLFNSSSRLREHFTQHYAPSLYESSESDIEYPLTPPPSDYSNSRPMSPETVPKLNLHVVTINVMESSEKSTHKHREVAKRRRSKRKTCSKAPQRLTLHVISGESSKGAIATVARTLAHNHSRHLFQESIPALDTQEFKLSVEDLNVILEGECGLPSPDLMVICTLGRSSIFPGPLELHGFPPWQIRLTEISRGAQPDLRWPWLHWFPRLQKSTQPIVQLNEWTFRAALDEYAGAEMRLGK